jgi:hypothetical protein
MWSSFPEIHVESGSVDGVAAVSEGWSGGVNVRCTGSSRVPLVPQEFLVVTTCLSGKVVVKVSIKAEVVIFFILVRNWRSWKVSGSSRLCLVGIGVPKGFLHFGNHLSKGPAGIPLPGLVLAGEEVEATSGSFW